MRSKLNDHPRRIMYLKLAFTYFIISYKKCSFNQILLLKMPNGVVEWPSHAIAEPILHWIGIAHPTNQAQARALHDALHNTSANLPTLSSFSFLMDTYMPGQSDLLFALFIIGILAAFSLLILLVVLFILCTSRRNIIKCGAGGIAATDVTARASTAPSSSASGVDAFSTDEKAHGKMLQCQRVLLFTVCAVLWTFLVFACALYACALGELVSPATVGQVGAVSPAEPGDGDESLTKANENDDKSAAGGGRFGRDNKVDAATELLRKFEDVRELGYQYRSLLSPGAPTLFLLFFVFIFYLATLVIALFATLIGINRGPKLLYLPSGDHHIMLSASARATSALLGRHARVRRTLASSALAFLCVAPLMFVLGSVLLVQAHAHVALCVQEQQTAQDLAIAQYVSSNFGTVPSPAAKGGGVNKNNENDDATDSSAAAIALPDFLADLKAERVTVNTENCRAEMAPINVLWLSSMLLALASLPFCISVLALLITAKCWSTGDDCAVGGGGISLRAYLPGWVQHTAPMVGPADAYKSLASTAVAGGHYQHYSISSRHHGGLAHHQLTNNSNSSTASPGATGDASQSSFGTFVYKKY